MPEIKELDIITHEKKRCYNNFLLKIVINLVRIPKIIQLIRKSNADIIHVHDAFAYGLFAYLSGRNYILTPWGSDVLIIPKKNKILKFIITKIIKKAKLILYDGGENLTKTLLKLKGSKEKMIRFNFGVDIKLFNKNKRSKDLRNKIIKSKKDKIIISTRNLNPIYNIETYISAANEILKIRKDVIFLIIGEGKEKKELKDKVKRYNIEKNVRFIGRLDSKLLSQYLASSDIYVSTSLSDAGLSCSTAEAMHSGLPVIITDFGENSIWVKNYENGFIFKSKDYKELSKKIIYLLNNAKKSNEYSKNNIKKINIKRNYYKEMKKIELIYKKVKNE